MNAMTALIKKNRRKLIVLIGILVCAILISLKYTVLYML